jgi:NAD+-dependent farnesol dehydrogenase
MKTLVTGATGFIGGRLVRLLSARGENVVALCRETSDVTALKQYNIEVRRGDIGNGRSLDDLFYGVDRIYHLAAYARNWARNPDTYTRVNVDGLRNVLQAAVRTGVSKVVFVSSEVTFGPSNGSPVTEKPINDADIFNDYQQSKIIAESVVPDYISQGLEVVIVNPSRLFGPGLLVKVILSQK